MNELETLVKRMGGKVHVLIAGWNAGKRTWMHTVFEETEWKDFAKKVKDV